MSADLLRKAAAKLRSPLPDFLAMVPRVVMGDAESMSDLAWCEDHTGWEGGPAPERPDESACWNCSSAELMHPELAELIRRLLAARESQAAWLDRAADHLCIRETVHCVDVSRALAVARAILGGES